ncbi:MAG: M23 family metallopeptidase [Pseudomonadota bacterium]
MKKTVTLFFMTNAGTPVRQFTMSKTVLRFLVLLIAGATVYAGFAVHDYYRLKQYASDARQLRKELANQYEETAIQRKQIQQFAQEINQLKTKLVALNEFENKIRVIANLEKAEEQTGLFGMGGSIPEDLDAQMPLTERHNSLVREMHLQTQELDTATSRQSEGFESLLGHLEEQVNLLASTPAVRPTTGWNTSGFGYRTSPFTGLREFHKGLDIATRKGTAINATADGIITFAGRKGLLGNVVIIDHGYGMVTRYGHCEDVVIKANDVVKRGDLIAKVGSTGRSTGPHLHYEVLLNGVPTDPEKYILN